MQKPNLQVLGLSFSIVIAAMGFQVAPSTVMGIIRELNLLNFTQAMLLANAPAFMSLFIMLPVGRFLNTRNPIRWSLSVSILLALVSALLLFMASYPFMLSFRFLGGLATAPAYIIGSQLPLVAFQPEYRNRFSAIQTLAAPIGTILATQTGGLIASRFGHTLVYIVPLLFSFIAIIFAIKLWSAKLPEIERPAQKNPFLPSVKTMLMAIVWALFSGATAGAFINTSTEIGIFEGLARPVASLGPLFLMVPSFFISPWVGSMLDKKTRRGNMLIVAGLAMTLSILILPIGKPLWFVGSILLGLSASLIPPVVFSSPGKFEPRHNMAYSLSIINLFGTIGLIASTPLVGTIRDATQSWPATMIAVSVFCFAISLTGLAFAKEHE
ncbi:MAG: MFS transporter [Caldisericia bacterium]|nr:MFS transporter [Caldisericia bacterium]